MSADMSGSVKQKRPIHSPLVFSGVFDFIRWALASCDFCNRKSWIIPKVSRCTVEHVESEFLWQNSRCWQDICTL